MTAPTPVGTRAVAVLNVGDRPGAFLPTVVSLRRSHPDLPIRAAISDGVDAGLLSAAGAGLVRASTATVVNDACHRDRTHVLLVGAPAAFPSAAIDRALALVDDVRVATVSFLCNAAAFLSFPARNAGAYQVESLDEEAITRRLRSIHPPPAPAPVPFAVGPAVLVSSSALSAIGPFGDVDAERPHLALRDLSLRARQKGFFDLLDPSTFCARLFDVGVPGIEEWLGAGPTWSTDDPSLGPVVEALIRESDDEASPLSLAHAVALAKVTGLRVLVDGSRLGPAEMGTQVQTVGLIAALAGRTDVETVCVALAAPAPPYAAAILDHPKVDARITPTRDFSGFGMVDVAHRPFQPDGPADLDALGAVAARSVITLLDLIAYHAVSYFLSPDDWEKSRRRLRETIAQFDAVVVPSHDVAGQIRLERLPIEPDRLFVVEIGTDSLQGDEPEAVPAELMARRFVAGEFLVVLGANYTHKNRDIAIEVFRELRRRGRDLSLVLAGAGVHGSSRVAETAAWGGEDGVFFLPGLSSPERNWLLRHAAVMLYPTSAEGFGLIPFEAARFGTPTVQVPFGPLAEMAGELPVTAPDWSAASLADAAERLLSDPEVAEAQVRSILASGGNHTWEGGAAKLVDVYRSLLARPPVGGRR